MKSSTLIITALCLVTSLLSSCSGETPQLYQIRWHLVNSMDAQGENIHEELLLYVQGEDEDGQDDLDSLRIESGDYYWEIPMEQLISHQAPGENWWGYTSLIMDGGKDFPREDFKVLLLDKAGQEGTYSWTIDGPAISPEEFIPPAVAIENGHIRIDDELGRSWLLLFHRNEDFIESEYIYSGIDHAIPPSMFMDEQGKHFFIIYVDPNTLRAWKQGPYDLDFLPR